VGSTCCRLVSRGRSRLRSEPLARAGVHAGEIESLPDGDVHGVAVQIAAGALVHARSDEVLVTQAVRDAVYGSSLTFSSRGEVDLAGIGRWQLYTATPD
jgi:class 3 adenylate cyclase